MDQTTDAVPIEVARTMEREMRIVREAIALVRCGAARRVSLASLRLAEWLLEPAQTLAAEAGVRLVPLERSDATGLDIAIERVPDEER